MAAPYNYVQTILSNIKLKLIHLNVKPNGQPVISPISHQGIQFKCAIQKSIDRSMENLLHLNLKVERHWADHIEICFDKFGLDRSILSMLQGTFKGHLGALIYMKNQSTNQKKCHCYEVASLIDRIIVNIEAGTSYEIRIILLDIYKNLDLYRLKKNQSLTQQAYFAADIVFDKTTVCPCTHVKGHVPIFTKVELHRLEQQCNAFVSNGAQATFTNYMQLDSMINIMYFYRNKSPSYFEDIVTNHCGNMEPYIKDMSGDARCPINGRLDGLFFMATLNRNSCNPKNLPPSSPFGSRRLIVPAEKLFNRYHRLYFSDFFCMKDHYVSLVITKPGSKADLYCQSHLLELDKFNNPYLKLGAFNEQIYVCRREGLWVEVMYTETINLYTIGGVFQTVPTLGKGESSKMGIPKQKNCSICNLNTA